MDSRNHATRRRQERQEQLREYLSERGKLEYIIDNIEKMEKEGGTLDAQELQSLKTANEQRIRLLSKYLPDLKHSEIDFEGALDVTNIISDEPMGDDEWEAEYSLDAASGSAESTD